MNYNLLRRLPGMAGLLVTWVAATPAVFAQGEEADPQMLEEIIVTVERREQNLQDYAGTAQSFSEDDLKSMGVGTDIRNLQVVVPGMNIANQEGNIEIFIRGVGSANNTELGDPGAAPHINGVYIPRPRGLGGQFYDIERVEVHKGPQGTLRGRNAMGGSLNIITRKPNMESIGGYVNGEIGDYANRAAEGAINLPISETLAVRLAGAYKTHDSYFENGGLDRSLTPAGEEDNRSARASLLWDVSDKFTVYSVLDYVNETGSGYPGTNLFAPFQAGYSFDDLEPRKVVYRGHQGDMDNKHTGFMVQLAYDFNNFSTEYSASYRKLEFQQTNAENDGVAFGDGDGPLADRDLAAVDYDNWSNVYWSANSTSMVHELRFFSTGDGPLTWTAGGFYFDEDQDVGFFSTSDHGFCCFSGTEFTMPDVQGESLAFYADGVYAFRDNFRIKSGIRYTKEEKSRFGIGGNFALVGGGDGFSCCFSTRFGTEGFVPAFQDRPSFDASDRSPAGLVALMLEGISRFGVQDTLAQQLAGIIDGSMPNGTCIDSPELDNGFLVCPENGQFSFLNITAPEQQDGEYSDEFLDWRLGFEYDLADQHLIYATVSSGHKSGGFNDNLTNPAYDPNDPDSSPTLNEVDFSPESLIVYELGSKNEFELGGQQLRFNTALFFYDYKDQVFQTLVAAGQGAGGQSVGLSLQNTNVADSEILGLELDGSLSLPYSLMLSYSAVLLDAKIKSGTIGDVRAQDFSDPANTPDADLSGNKLPLASDLSASLRLQQVIPVASGSFDWQILASYRSSYYLTPFNEEPIFFRDGTVSEAATSGYAGKQEGFATVNLGLGYNFSDSKYRVELFGTNILDETASEKSLVGPDLNLRFLNTPRTYGLRVNANF